MNLSNRIAVGVLVALAVVMPVSNALAADRCGEASQAWVKENLRTLPANLAQFSVVPAEHQRAVFNMLKPELKSQLWREHLTEYLKAHPRLSTEQVQVIRDALTEISPALYREARGVEAQPEVHARLEALKARFLQLFGDTEARAVLEQLGPSPSYMAPKTCSCSTQSDWCGAYEDCGQANCVYAASGCGTFLSYSCDGMCRMAI